MNSKNLNAAYELAKERYAELGVDTGKAMDELNQIPISMHCWQGDDVAGFENPEQALTGGIQVIGAYPVKARNPEELRADIEKAFFINTRKAQTESACILSGDWRQES